MTPVSIARAAALSVHRERRAVTVSGRVQGVGFRPFVYRLAAELGLAGWVTNADDGVRIEVEGDAGRLARFVDRLRSEVPARAVIGRVSVTPVEPIGASTFVIRPSSAAGAAGIVVPPDATPCDPCRREIFDPSARRYRYPFTQCATCGPRYTIISAMPYDRANTTMAGFAMCAACHTEYEDPSDRRFHAEAVACPACGPRAALWDADGRVLGVEQDAVIDAARAIRNGRIVAVKGVGGFHLLVDATNDAAVRELRRRKRRPDKPFALLCESPGVVESLCRVADIEAALLRSAEGPIVLLRARTGAAAPAVAPNNPNLGVMLPPSPLHLLLAREVGVPVVATSGNRSDEPICTDEREALTRLRGIADVFLVHDRPIARHVDDSVVRVIGGDGVVLRVGRGYAPLSVPGSSGTGVIAVGGGHKNTVAVSTGDGIVLSQHIGTLNTPHARTIHRRTATDLARLHGVLPSVTAGDLHPDDSAASHGAPSDRPATRVQHHHAHVLSCLAEHGLDGPALGVAWDGTGYGPDGTVWGGEFLAVHGASWRRIGHLRRFRLPGGESAVREPRRAALGVLVELFGNDAVEHDTLPPLASWPASQRALLARTATRGVNAPWTSSAGRLFDAVASLIGIRQVATFEGQAAMELEFAAQESTDRDAYPVAVIDQDGVAVVDWEPLVRAMLDDAARGEAVAVMARRFHDALADAIVAVAIRAGERRVALTGGCFQNRCLTERATARLTASGFLVYRHRLVPPNDGGLAVGQAIAAGARL
ncbi:MAG: carbamoyltransferase HypF [Nitrospirota bacterium]